MLDTFQAAAPKVEPSACAFVATEVATGVDEELLPRGREMLLRTQIH